MTLIESSVKKLFGYNHEKHDINSVEFMKQAIKDAPSVLNHYHEYGSDEAIKDFLFEQTDLSKELKKILEKYKYETEEENPQSIH